MEKIETGTSVVFDVIDADGARHRVNEGILFEVDGIEMILHCGTTRLAAVLATAESALAFIEHLGETERFCKELGAAEQSFPGRRVLTKILAAFSPWHGEKQAIFRLGQMDMRVSTADMLRAMADGAAVGIRPGLILAADLVESMEVMNENSGG